MDAGKRQEWLALAYRRFIALNKYNIHINAVSKVLRGVSQEHKVRPALTLSELFAGRVRGFSFMRDVPESHVFEGHQVQRLYAEASLREVENFYRRRGRG